MFGNVPSGDLESHFSQFGTVTKVCPYFQPESTHNYGTYITFDSQSAARAALRNDDLTIGGFRVQVYRHTGPIPSYTTQVVSSSQGPKIVKVSMFNGQLTADELYLLAQPCGPLVSKPVVRNGNPPYSYINFIDANSAKRASESIHQTQYNGVLLKARLFETKSSHSSSRSSTSITAAPAATSTTQYPSTWQPQTGDVELFDIPLQCQEWREVVTKFRATMPQERIVSLKRIQHKDLYEEYDHKKQKMAKKSKPQNEKRLFHGSGSTNPQHIYEQGSKGFDFRFSGQDLHYGRGAYFAEKASFADLFSYQSQHGHKEIFMATVLTGDSCWMSRKDKTLTMPPLKPGSKERYDSVSACHDAGSNIFVIYEHDLAYPEYLISYN